MDIKINFEDISILANMTPILISNGIIPLRIAMAY